MNLSFLLSALRARSRLFAAIVLTTVIATLAVSLIVPKTYIAKASLLVDGKHEQSLSNSALPQERERVGYLQTQVDIITSPKVSRRVINDLKLELTPSLQKDFRSSSYPGSFHEWMTERLLKRLKVDTSQSSIIQLAFSADDPAFAAQVANGFGKAYIDTVLEMRVEPLRQTSTWFDEQLKGLRANMEQAERNLAEYQRQNGIVSNDEHYDMENIQLTDLAGQVARSRSSSGGLRRAGSIANAESLPEIQANQNIQNLKSNVIRAETKLQELSSELGDRHPQYLRQSAELESLRERMNTEIKGALASSEQSARREQQRKQQLLSAMAAQRERVMNLKQARNHLGVLSNDVTIAQRTYDVAMQRFMASKIESRAQLSTVSVFNEALPPPRPARPNLPLNLALALLIGALVGLATVHLIELSDHRVRLIDDLDGNAQTPLLAVLNARDPITDRYLANAAPLQALPGPG